MAISQNLSREPIGQKLSQRRLLAAVGVTVLVVILAFPRWVRADDEFKAMPGLWKTSMLPADSAARRPSTVVSWHCVFEGSDPWTNFAFLSTTDRSCKTKYAGRTSTSLKWLIECTSPSNSTYQGSIAFSNAENYTGKVEVRATLMGYPIDQTIILEGKRYAACTSPQD